MVIHTLCVLGTRPEAIKMAPLIKRLSASATISNKTCITGQHRQMLGPLLDLFEITSDFDLKVMAPNQDLTHLTTKILQGLSTIFKHYQPDLVLVQGDTTTALVGAMAAYYHRIPIAHVEAGLRTNNIYSPWPEEANRKLISTIAALHFSPTSLARANLLKEGVPAERIFVTGNTVIDALLEVSNKLDANLKLAQRLEKNFPFLSQNKGLTILVTGHRRESFGEGFRRICQALMSIARQYKQVKIVYPVHLNPNVQGPVKSLLRSVENIYLLDPVDYLSFVYLMKQADIILTDSGGIQEEAPSLGKPVLVMRDLTERPEALAAGTAKLVGSQVHQIVEGVAELLYDKALYRKMSQTQNPYGDGKAAPRIVKIIENSIHWKVGLKTPVLMEKA